MTDYHISNLVKHEWLATNIVKITVAEDLEVTESMALELYELICSEVDEPFALINDRVNEYEHTLEILTIAGDFPEIVFHAVVIHDEADRPVIETQQMMNPALKLYTSMEAALAAAHKAVG